MDRAVYNLYRLRYECRSWVANQPHGHKVGPSCPGRSIQKDPEVW